MLGFDASTLAWIAAGTILAFVVRGLAGFGSSMVGIGSLSLALPAQVVPAFMVIELATSVNLLPGAWRHIDWRSLRWLCSGCVIGTPLGLVVLAGLDPNPMRLFVFGCLLCIALGMLSGVLQRLAPQQTPGARGAALAGVASGVLTGAAGIGGPPAIVFYFATTSVAVSRATLVAYLMFTDICALGWIGTTGVLGIASWWRIVVVALPFSLLGTLVGTRWYTKLADAQLRRIVWSLCAALGGIGVATALVRLTLRAG